MKAITKPKNKFYIGASDMGTVCGVNKWSSYHQLLMQKWGLIEREKLDEEYVENGRAAEERIINILLKKFPKLQHHLPLDKVYMSDDKTLLCIPDGLERTLQILVECKSKWFRKGQQPEAGWLKEFPDWLNKSYIYQCQTELAISGWKKCLLVIETMNVDKSELRYNYMWIYRDEIMINEIKTKAALAVEQIKEKMFPASADVLRWLCTDKKQVPKGCADEVAMLKVWLRDKLYSKEIREEKLYASINI